MPACRGVSSNPMIHELRAFASGRVSSCSTRPTWPIRSRPRPGSTIFRQQPGVKAVAISCKKASDVARIPGWPSNWRRTAAMRQALRLMIMGIPNVGKSTLDECLVKKKVAAVGDQPAVTKSQQRIDISSRLTIYDTPGMLWPKIAHPIDGLMLAASHAVGVNAYIDEEVATFLAGFLLEHYPALLTARYGFETAWMRRRH
jgi:ribosome biogenesis GTPase A